MEQISDKFLEMRPGTWRTFNALYNSVQGADIRAALNYNSTILDLGTRGR
jgi:replication-associated recombination protein RarA